MPDEKTMNLPPGVCYPWEEKKKEYAALLGDETIVKKVWEDIDQLAYIYIWFCLISS